MLNIFYENKRTSLCVKSNMDVFLKFWNCNIKHAMKTNLFWFTLFTQLCDFKITANIKHKAKKVMKKIRYNNLFQ